MLDKLFAIAAIVLAAAVLINVGNPIHLLAFAVACVALAVLL